MRKTARHKLGNLGEHWLATRLGLTLSSDPYDTEGDLFAQDGTRWEVKTQTRYSKLNVFSIRATKEINRKKCMTVAELIFVEYDKGDTIKAWRVTDRNSTVSYTTRSGLQMLGWPISRMQLLIEETDAELAAQMRALSTAAQFIV